DTTTSEDFRQSLSLDTPLPHSLRLPRLLVDPLGRAAVIDPHAVHPPREHPAAPDVHLEKRPRPVPLVVPHPRKHEVPQPVEDELLSNPLFGLNDVRVRADDEVGAVVDEAATEGPLHADGLRRVLAAPMVEDDE